MICRVNQITVSVWNTTLGWNRLNKSESFMTVIIVKANPIQIGQFQGSQKLRVGRELYRKAYVGAREMKLGNRV